MMQSRPRLSLVVPVFNEERCTQDDLVTVPAYLDAQPYSAEIIVVDDGSHDRTAEIVAAFAGAHTGVRLIRNDHRGKACAVRTGVFEAGGDYVVFTDAGLATPIHQIGKLLVALDMGNDVAIASLEGCGTRRLGEPWTRHFMGRHKDTQCGCKGFRRRAAPSRCGP